MVLTFISKFSEIKQSRDNRACICFNEGAQNDASVRMGSGKGRRTGEISPCEASVTFHHTVGVFHYAVESSTTQWEFSTISVLMV